MTEIFDSIKNSISPVDVESNMMEQDCEEIYNLRKQKKSIEQRLEMLEKRVKGILRGYPGSENAIGRFLVTLRHMEPGRIVDTARLKADGLFETYSKEKAGYDALLITEDVRKDDIVGQRIL